MVSRGMSHVSAMILATVSNVEDIDKFLNCKDFIATPKTGAAPRPMLGSAPESPWVSRVPV
jgi:hypothetical protein